MKRLRFLLLSIFIAGFFSVLFYHFTHVPRTDLKDIDAVFERVQETGSYRFSADVVQKTIPLPQVTNIGRQSREESMYIEGQTNNPEQKMELSIWLGGDSFHNQDDALQIRLEHGQAQARRPGGEWEVLDEYASLYAPEGDMLAYLTTAKNVSNQGGETRSGITYTRYTFEIDGPAFAAYLRTQTEKRMHESGELPSGISLELPQMYAEMEGEGELWVGEDGLPIRQLIYLHFPNTANDQVEARIDVTFSNYLQRPKQAYLIPQLASFFTGDGIWQVAIVILFMAVFMIMLAFRRSKTVYASVVILVIASMLLTPLLESAQVKAFADNQLAQRQEAETLQQEEQLFENLREKLVARLNTPLEAGQAEVALQNGYSRTALSLTSLAGNPQPLLQEDNGEDSDADGLTDYQEQQLGTDPQDPDTDGDGVSDKVEVLGFEYPAGSGKRWYTDPWAYDTNDDGMPDLFEYADPVNGVPADADQDGLPDLFTDDNDGDSVPDDQDLSPSQTTKNGTLFDRTRPFVLKIDNLSTQPTYVEFQLRPFNDDHLSYAQNVLDWPEDRQGQIQDADGQSYADKYGTAGSGTNAENGDIKLIPLLEIRLSGEPDNLPSADTLEDLYGITYMQRSSLKGEKAVYVPLQPVVEPGGGERLAFYGKMLYDPQGLWNNQEVRLAWVVQMLVDECGTYNDLTGLCATYAEYNKPQIIQVYYDDWYLTGLNIQENLGYTQGIVWEDPAVDENLVSDDMLTALTNLLDGTFLNGSDNDQDGEPDVTIAEIQSTYDHLTNISVTGERRYEIHDTMRVYTETFSHADEGQSTLAKITTYHPTYYQILESNFRPLIDAGQTVTPTLLILSEERFRTANLDDSATGAISWNGNQLSVDMSQGDLETSKPIVTERWQSYRFDGDRWTPLSVEEQWDEIVSRYRILYQDEPDQEVAEQKRLLLAYYSLALYNTQSNVIGTSVGEQVNLEKIRDEAMEQATAGPAGAVFEALGTRLFRRSARELAKDLGNKIKPGLFTSQKASNPKIAGTLGQWGMGLEATALAMNLISSSINDETAERWINFTGNMMMATALVLDDIVGGYKAFAALNDVAKLSTSAKIWEFARKVDVKGSVSGCLLDLGIIWGSYAFQYFMGGGNSMSAMLRHALAANAFATSLIAVTIFIISLFTGNIVAVGVEIILLIIDAFLKVFGESALAEKLAAALQDVSLVASPDAGILETYLRQDPDQGLVAPTTVEFTAGVEERANRQDPDNWMAQKYGQYWVPDILKRSDVETSLTAPFPDTTGVKATHDSVIQKWLGPGYDVNTKTFGVTKYKIHDVTFEIQEPGVNISLPVHLNLAYDVPYVSCVYYLAFIDCELDFQAGATSIPLGNSIILDVLPATLDEFYSLAWDDLFGVQRDRDGDGLLAGYYGGIDPDDSRADTDADGLSDAYELELRAAGNRAAAPSLLSADTDNDGLGDALEVRLGTLPNQRDSDGDGLTDGEEVFHQIEGTNDWAGGWAFTVTSTLGTIEPITTLVTSDPLKSDTDGDGLDDKAERTLKANPRAWTPSPLVLTAMVDEAERIIAPGGSFVYTVTVANQLQNDPPLYVSGELQATMPTVLGGETFTDTLTVQQSQASSLSRQISVPSAISTPGGSLQATLSYALTGFMHDGNPEIYWKWDDKEPTRTQPLKEHWPGFPPFASLTARKAESSNLYPYVVASIERPKSADQDAHVNLRQAEDTLSGPLDVLPSTSPFPRRFLGGYSPGIACNDSGLCLVTWERSNYDVNAWLQLEKVQWKSSYQFQDGYPPYMFGLHIYNAPPLTWPGFFSPDWQTPWDFNSVYPGRDPHTFYMDVPYKAIFNTNTGIFLLTREVDAGRECGFDVTGGYQIPYRDGPKDECDLFIATWPVDYFDPNHPFYADYHKEANPFGNFVSIDANLFRPYYDRIYGRLQSYSSDGTVKFSGDEFVIGDKVGDQTSFDDYGPSAVATDGTDFLVVWVSNQGVHSRLISSDGDLYSIVTITSVSESRENTAPQVVWVEAQGGYLVTWYDGGVRSAFLKVSGNKDIEVIENPVLTGSLAQPQMGLAVKDASSQVMLVFPVENTLFGLWLNLQSGHIAGGHYHVVGQLSAGETAINSPSVSYEPFSGGWLVSWLAQTSSGQTMLHYAALDAAGNPLLDKIGLGPSATHPALTGEIPLDSAIQQDLACSYQASDYAHCAVAGIQGSDAAPQLFLQPISMAEIPPSLGEVQTSVTTTVWVDALGPTTVFSLTPGDSFPFMGTRTIGGSAEDPGEVASGVKGVWVSTDSGASWSQANGAESWAYNWTVPEEDGPVNLQVKAQDKVGNWGPVTSVNIILDRSAPGELSLVQPGNANPVQAFQDENNTWRLPLVIQAVDAGRDVASVSVSLEPLGSGWQEAAFDGENWTLAYPFSPLDPDTGAIAQPTDAYTVRLSARDKAGNTRTEIVPWLVQVDNTPPEVSLTFPTELTQVITQTVEITGVITDTGSVASGVNLVEIAVVPVGGEPASWTAITPDTPGAVASTWRYLLPGNLDSLYQIWLRGSDLLGNQREASLAGQFLVEVDTRAPEGGCTFSYLGAGSAAQTEYDAWAQDFNLSEGATGLRVTGSEDLLPLQFVQKFYYDDPWYLATINDITRLNRLEFSGILNGHIPLSLATADRHEHAVQIDCQDFSSTSPTLSSAVLQPINGSAIISETSQANPTINSEAFAAQDTTALAPEAPLQDSILIEGGAYAADGLSSLSLTANGTEIYSTTWAAPAPTDILWATSWLPVADGTYELIPVVTDINRQEQADLQPIVVTVDRQPPVLTLASNSLSMLDRISYNRVMLTGTANDNLGLEGVEISADGGTTWQPASLDGASWRFAWSAGGIQGDELDGVTKPINIRAVDTAGLTAQIDRAVTIDLQAPTPVTMTLSVDAGAGLLPLEPGETIRETEPTLFINWTTSSDGGGPVTYWAGWSPEQTVEFADLQEYQDAYQHAQLIASDPQVLYAHLILRDPAGNERHMVEGPVYVDQPGPPDLISDLHYRDWMDETCNLVGADYEVSHYTPKDASLSAVQELYASWDGLNLRLTYAGAFWDKDGDLFIYLDTAPGGATTAYDPYEMGPAIQLPGEFAADKLVFVEDTQSAMLLTWNGSGWEDGLLAENQFRYDAASPGYTDLLLPWASLGDPGSFKLLALASEEDALRIWAAIPEKNPLNSARAVDTLASTYLDRLFSLQHFLTLDRAGACPNNGQVVGSDLHFNLSAEPNGAVAGYLADDLASLLAPGDWLDNNLDGLPDQDLPVDLSSAWVGEGQPIAYTLTYTNTGTVAANNVVVNLSSQGLHLTGENPILIGTVAAGEGGVLTISADMLAGVLSGELRLEIADARHGPFEWLWALHRVDKEPPQNLILSTPALYVRPGPNLITGRVFDPSGVAAVILSVNPPDEQVSCQPPALGDDLWACTWTPPISGQTFQAQAQASDIFGNTSGWTAVTNWMLDNTPPTLDLSPGSQDALAGNILLPTELLLSGSITDDYSAAAVKVCAVTVDNPLEICEWARLTSSVTPATATWEVQVPIAGVVDGILHTLSITGYDTAGNPSSVLSFENLYVDLAGPTITVSQYHSTVLQAQLDRMLAGFISDGSGVASLSMRLIGPTGSVQEQPCADNVSPGQLCQWTGNAWMFTARFDEVGRYSFALEASDTYGNKSQYGPAYFQVVPRTTATDLSLELSASPGTAISSLPLTYTASIHNAGPGIAAGIIMTATLPAEVSLASAPTFCQLGDHTLICSIPDLLSVDNSQTVQFMVNVPVAVTTTLTCEALVSSSTTDLDKNNNRHIVYTPVIQPVAGLTATSDSPTPLGAATTLTATVTRGNPVYYQWDFGDGQTGDGTVVHHAYLALGVYTATVTASNAYNHLVTSTQVEVINLAPQVITTGMDQLTYEDELTWTGYIYFTDPNSPDFHTLTIDWGDGEISNPEELIDYDYGGKLLGSHTYADPGVYTATVTVLDAYGGIGTGSFPITVLHGFMRLCAYADGQDPGVTIYPLARLDCGWTKPDALTRITASGIGSRGYILAQEGAVITGSLRSEGMEVISDEDVRLVGGQLEREFDLLSIGNIDSQGNVDLGMRTNITDDIASRDNVKLRAHSFVGGDVIANGEVTLGAGAIISGTLTELASLPPIPPITPVTLSFVAGWQDISVAQGAVLSLDPGKYRYLTIKKEGTLNLKAGWYTFESIMVEQDASIQIDLTKGALLVDVVKTLFMGENTYMKITSNKGAPDKILFRIGGTVVYLKKGGEYLGTYLAPNGQARLGEDALLTGALYGKSVHVMDRAQIVGMPARNLFAITMVNPNLPLGCEEKVTCTFKVHLPVISP